MLELNQHNGVLTRPCNGRVYRFRQSRIYNGAPVRADKPSRQNFRRRPSRIYGAKTWCRTKQSALMRGRWAPTLLAYWRWSVKPFPSGITPAKHAPCVLPPTAEYGSVTATNRVLGFDFRFQATYGCARRTRTSSSGYEPEMLPLHHQRDMK